MTAKDIVVIDCILKTPHHIIQEKYPIFFIISHSYEILNIGVIISCHDSWEKLQEHSTYKTSLAGSFERQKSPFIRGSRVIQKV